MAWYLLTTKVRSEDQALKNLTAQGFECFLPQVFVEKLRRGALRERLEPLFPRYLFIQLEEGDHDFGAVKNTRGVSSFVGFGQLATAVSDALVSCLMDVCAAGHARIKETFLPGEKVRLLAGPFKGLVAVFQCPDGERRSLVLIELLHRTVELKVENAQLQAFS